VATVADVFALAWKHHQAGSFSEAENLYREILKVDPGHADSWCFLGAACQAQGKMLDAEMYFRRAVQILPDHPSAGNCLGVILAQQGKYDDAGNLFQDLALRQPGDAGVHNNLGLIRARQGRWQQAIACYRQALAVQPDFEMAKQNLAYALQQTGQTGGTIGSGTGFRPQQRQADVHNDQGVALANQGRYDEAAAEFERALQIEPANAKAHSNLGNIHYFRGRYDEAIARYQQAVALKPDYAEALSNLGNLLLLKGRFDEALVSCREAVRLKPNFAGAYLNLGNALREKSQPEESMGAYRQVIRLEPSSADAHSNLAGLLKDQGDIEQATVHYEEAVRLRPSNALRILRNTLLPTLYQSADEMLTWRQRLTDNVRRLHEEGIKLDVTTETAQPPFHLAYQGFNDRDLQQQIARLYKPPQDLPLPDGGAKRPDGKLRVGLISKYFKFHTIGHWFRGLVAQLSRGDFEVTVMSIGRYDDDNARFFKQHADSYLEVPKHLPSARRLIAEQQLDVLLYTDIGMDPISYSLAFSRLAPVQCVTLGHPVTTGIDTIDYYISSETLESDEAQDHYTEKLIRLKNMPVYFYRPNYGPPFKKRKDYRLQDGDHLYACMQTAFKFHPEFDEILGGILRGDPKGKVVLSRWSVPRWEKLLLQRFSKTLPDVVDRIQFLPMLNYQDYLNALALADVQLDTLHFGGGSTSYDGFTVGTPIVTCPTKFLRGRITQALYRQMDVTDCIARDKGEYIATALRLGTDPDYRRAIHEKILNANHALFENSAGVRDLEAFLSAEC
jgi:predicted O-linked N-acetylglucosamine transferase (SPINDLY family)